MVKSNKFYYLDQLINFYTYLEQFNNCEAPLNEILKIMDKTSFCYDVDLTPTNHVYYYITATLYSLTTNESINLNKTLHYLFNVMTIVYNNLETFDVIPHVFYETIFTVVDIIRINYDRPDYCRNPKKGRLGELTLAEDNESFPEDDLTVKFLIKF